MESTTIMLMALTLKNQLKLLLEQRNMSAAQLSRKSGVSPQVLSLWLKGADPKKMSQVKKVADILGVSVDELCFGNGIGQEAQRVTELDALLGESWVSGIFEVRFRRIKKAGSEK